MSSALPYHVYPSAQNALILASSSGAQILQAHSHDIAKIDAVEADSQLSQLITEKFSNYFDWNNLKHKVKIHSMSPRGFSASEHYFDLVIMGPSGSSTGGSAGVHALSTSYNHTVEALQSYLKLLAPDGLLSITLWTSTPARGNLKLFISAVEAMKKSGIKNPEKNIAWIRSWNTATLLLKNTRFSFEEINRVRDFTEARSFDLAWLPGIKLNEINRFQLLQKPVFYLTAKSIFNDPENRFIQQYQYNIQFATDNRPYFNNYFKR